MPRAKTTSKNKGRGARSSDGGKSATGKLVIVESPAKARTLSRILGRSYSIKASLGHVRDLPKSDIGVAIEDDFTPKYVVPAGKRKTVSEIKQAAGSAGSVYLATDPDREGEAISWHLVQATGLDKHGTPVHRVSFHEISKEAVEEAFRNPRPININMVNAQQARRILDRLVGYKLSPLLWRKVQRGLSAGRVQSVTVKMIVDREQEIRSFVSQEYWVIEVQLAPVKEKQATFTAKLTALADGTKLEIGSRDEAEEVIAHLKKADYTVKSVQTRQVSRQPSPPFITSTLQQEAWRKLRFTSARTMAIAQQLYEGVALGKEGPVGLITYMRTDSTNVAPAAIGETRDFIRSTYGARYLPAKARSFARKGKWAQEAHEAIRPTSIRRQPEQLKPFLNTAQLKLYELIWKRMAASQMSAALYDTTSVDVEASHLHKGKTAGPADGRDGPSGAGRRQGYLLRASSSAVKFAGFMIVYSEGSDDDEHGEGSAKLPSLSDGDKLAYLDVFPEQCYTQPPPRYTEATLVKALEQKGIGRPSTYAPIISTIQEREYVSKQDGKFAPTELGMVVNKILVEHFARIVEVGFTARMEEQLDEIARGNHEWTAALKEFYPPFDEMLSEAWTKVEKITLTQATEEICPKCSQPMVVKVGRFGKFLACSGYPECKTTRPYTIKTGVSCPECGKEMVEKVSRKKKVFYGCSNYPQCNFATNRRPIAQPCPHCGKLLVQHREDWARCLGCSRRVSLSRLEKGGDSGNEEPSETRDTS